VLAVAALLAGCGATGSAQDQDASRSVTRFYRALSVDPRSACDLLAPGTRHELEDTFGPCSRSLAGQDLPEAGSVLHVDVYGKDAMIRLDDDVAFLALFRDGWRVTAAGCTPREGRPFDCVLSGE
jgi:hypothetical protein